MKEIIDKMEYFEGQVRIRSDKYFAKNISIEAWNDVKEFVEYKENNICEMEMYYGEIVEIYSEVSGTLVNCLR